MLHNFIQNCSLRLLIASIWMLGFVLYLPAQYDAQAASQSGRKSSSSCFLEIRIDQTSTYIFGETMDLVMCGDIEADTDCGDGKKSQTTEVLLYSIFPAGAAIHGADPHGSVTFSLISDHPDVVGKYFPAQITNSFPLVDFTEHFLISTAHPVTISWIDCIPQPACANAVAGIDFNFRTKELVATMLNGSGNFDYDWTLTSAMVSQPVSYTGVDRVPLPCGIWDASLTVTDLADGCQYTFSDQFSFEDCGPKPPAFRLGKQTSDFGIFPNPTSTDFVLQHSYEGLEPLTLEILDMQGKRIRSQALSSTRHQSKIQLPQLPPGMYFVKVHAQDQTLYTEKLLLK